MQQVEGYLLDVPLRPTELCHLVISAWMIMCLIIHIIYHCLAFEAEAIVCMCVHVPLQFDWPWNWVEHGEKQWMLLWKQVLKILFLFYFSCQLSENKELWNCRTAWFSAWLFAGKHTEGQLNQHSSVIKPRNKLSLC